MQWRWVIALVLLYLGWGLFGRSEVKLDSSWQEASREQTSSLAREEPTARAPVPGAGAPERRREAEQASPTLVPSRSVKAIAEAPAEARPINRPKRWVEVTGSKVNLRAAPRTSARKLMSVSKPARLLLMAKDEPWAFVQDPVTLTEGWMHLNYLKPAQRGGLARAN